MNPDDVVSILNLVQDTLAQYSNGQGKIILTSLQSGARAFLFGQAIFAITVLFSGLGIAWGLDYSVKNWHVDSEGREFANILAWIIRIITIIGFIIIVGLATKNNNIIMAIDPLGGIVNQIIESGNSPGFR